MADSSDKIVPFPSHGSDPGIAPATGVAPYQSGSATAAMRSDLVEEATKLIPEPPVLINAVSRRVKQLNMGRSPLVEVGPRMGAADIALMEIIQGKILVEEQEAE